MPANKSGQGSFNGRGEASRGAQQNFPVYADVPSIASETKRVT